jgi:LacI family transcriptional regulator
VKKVTIKDIAKELKVTPMTVSNALTGKGRVSGILRDRIVQKAKQLNYRPNSFARALVSGKTNRIAVVMPGFTSLFGMAVLESVERCAVKLDYEVNAFSNEGERDAFKTIIDEGKADAVIAIGMNTKPEIEELYDKASVPFVLVEGHGAQESKTVEIDNEKAAFDAVTYLALKKRKRIAIAYGAVDMALSQSYRIKGYRAALKKAGLEYDPKLAIKLDKYTFDNGSMAFEALSGRRIDALFCAAGDMVAAGFIIAARAHDLRVPEDIAVIGFDDIAAAVAIDLTTVRQPLQEMGEIAFGKVSSMLGGSKAEGKKSVLQAELICRGTA